MHNYKKNRHTGFVIRNYFVSLQAKCETKATRHERFRTQ